MSDFARLFLRIEQEAERIEDERGWLQVLYESDAMVLKRSFSRAGVFRGLHGQRAPYLQEKIIRVVSGRILDFVLPLDAPSQSPAHREIGPDDGWIRIDARLAHGFYAIEDTLFEYVCDGRYDEAAEQAFSIVEYLRDELGITDPILSAKDRAAPPAGAAR